MSNNFSLSLLKVINCTCKTKIMNIKTIAAAFGIALTTFAITAKAQKTINEGYASYATQIQGQPADVKEYFKPDSTAIMITFGAGNVKVLTDAKRDYMAVILDIPVAQLKKAGIATPSEIEDAMNSMPTFKFTPTTDTKVISGFNCKRILAKSNSGKEYDVWVTNDVVVPATAIPYYYQSVGGMPIQFTAFQKGQDGSVQEIPITITGVTAGKAPAGTFAIASDFEKVGMSDLHP
jgi:hypothetical protein